MARQRCLIAAAVYLPQARSTHFARDLLKVFGGGIAQALRLILITDLLERRHGGIFQNLGGLTFVFDVGPVKNL
jgi:hypothetical protein